MSALLTYFRFRKCQGHDFVLACQIVVFVVLFLVDLWSDLPNSGHQNQANFDSQYSYDLGYRLDVDLGKVDLHEVEGTSVEDTAVNKFKNVQYTYVHFASVIPERSLLYQAK